ncbi:MAG: hypothetical protein OQK67_07900 [Chlorobium sp.]|nr:hypothetical protein [Chlorobium sp.]MCW8814465.1 hypothetical protein [Chlorobium sp.]MCW8819544.1 hypothetical protein [Ignavibacteriaceae bacterium]
MLIDWFTVIAQLVNFLVLVWLLKRFLYQPVLKAIDEREKKIASELQHAAEVEKEAGKRLVQLEKKNEAFDNDRARMLRQAEEEAGERKHAMLEEARKEYDSLRMRLQETLQNEEKNLEEEVIGRIGSEVFAIAGRVLEDLAGVTLDERMVDVFCERLRHPDSEEMKEMQGAFSGKPLLPVVHTAFNLSPEQRERIGRTLHDVFSIDAEVTFESADDLVDGIELSMNGHSVSWSVRSYLASLEKMTRELLDGGEETSRSGER